MKTYKRNKYVIVIMMPIILCGIIGSVLVHQSYTALVASYKNVENSFENIMVQSNIRQEKVKSLIEYLDTNQINDEESDFLKESYGWVEDAKTREEMIMSDSGLTTALFRLFAKVEGSAEMIQQDEEFLLLFKELYEINDKMSEDRKAYNDCVIAYNNLLLQFPARVIAKQLNYEEYTTFTMGGEGKMMFKAEQSK